MFRTLNSTQVSAPITLTPEEIRKLSNRCLNIATRLHEALEKVDQRGVKNEEREDYFNLVSLKNEIRSQGLKFSRQSMYLTLKATDLNEYRQEIEGATQKLKDAIAQLEQSNAILGKLALGINFVASILETLAGGGVVSIAGSMSELDTLLG